MSAYQNMTISEVMNKLESLEVTNRALLFSLDKKVSDLQTCENERDMYKRSLKQKARELKEANRELRVIKEAHSIINNCYA